MGRLLMAGMMAPDSFKPQWELLQVQAALQGQYRTVMKKQGFDDLDSARAGMFLCAVLIRRYGQDQIIDPTAAAGIVAEKVMEAAKTVPLPVE